MKKKSRISGFVILPMLLSIVSAYYEVLWLIPVVVILMFVLVGTISFCRKNENLWMFVLTGFCSIPVNWFLLTKFNMWMYLYSDSGKIITTLVIIQYIIALTGLEEVVLGLFTRILWKKQYRLYIPVDVEEE